MAGLLEMGKGVCVLRILAAAHVTAGETDPQLVPRLAQRRAFFARVGAGLHVLDYGAEMFAGVGHGLPVWGHARAGETKGCEHARRTGMSNGPTRGHLQRRRSAPSNVEL